MQNFTSFFSQYVRFVAVLKYAQAINGGHFGAGVGRFYAQHARYNTSLDSGISTIMTTQRHVTNALHSGNVRLAGAFLRLYCLFRRQSDPGT